MPNTILGELVRAVLACPVGHVSMEVLLNIVQYGINIPLGITLEDKHLIKSQYNCYESKGFN